MTSSSVWDGTGPVSTATPLARVAVLRDGTVDAFIGDLRKFVVHRTLAAILAGAGALDQKPAASLSTDVRDLREWGGWSVPGRVFLSTLGDDEALDRALSTYRTHVVEFCAWLGKWQAAVHRGALEELTDLQHGFRNPKARIATDPAVEHAAAVPASWLDHRLPSMAS